MVWIVSQERAERIGEDLVLLQHPGEIDDIVVEQFLRIFGFDLFNTEVGLVYDDLFKGGYFGSDVHG